jgi:hypothetical protein
MKGLLKIALLLSIILTCITGCGKTETYSTSFNLNTDCQSSYNNNDGYTHRIQSDGKGQYIFCNNYLYYHNEANNTLVPVCSKANCLHDKETDTEKKRECNAFLYTNDQLSSDGYPITSISEMIQYNEGYIYYINGNSIFRIKADGSAKDCIYKTKEDIPICNFMVHRGYIYYETQPFKRDGEKVYEYSNIYKIKISDHMTESNAVCLVDLEKEGKEDAGFFQFDARKDNILYSYSWKKQGVKCRVTPYDWHFKTKERVVLYDTKKEKETEIKNPLPKNMQTRASAIKTCLLLDQSCLVFTYDEFKGDEEPMPVYMVDYKTGKKKLWNSLPNSHQQYLYKNYVIDSSGIVDVDLRAHVYYSTQANYTIYDINGKKIANYRCPTYQNEQGGDVVAEGFGPDGVQILREKKKDCYNLYEVKFDEVLKLHGETIKPKKIGTIPIRDIND